MGYVSSSRGDRLGFFIVDDLLAVAGAVKGIQSIVNSAQSAFGAGGKSTDEQRQARAAYFGQSALAGSVTAARYLLGGTQNTGGHEVPYYQSWINKLASDANGADVLAEAELQGPKWAAGVPDPGGTQQMFNDVKQDLLLLGKSAPSTSGTGVSSSGGSAGSTGASGTPGSQGTPGAYRLPAMQTTAPFNWTPFLVAGGFGLAAVAVASKRPARRRR